MPRIKVIGVGPGSEDYLTPAARKALDAASAVVGGERHIRQMAAPWQKTFILKSNLGEALEFIRLHREAGVAVLASGDPGMYGILKYLRRHFRREDLEVIPGVSAVQLAFARLAVPWEDARILSAHGRKAEGAFLAEAVRTSPKVAILTDPRCPPASIARMLAENGLAAQRIYCCCNLSYPDECVVETSARELLEKQIDLPPNCVVVILNEG